jgi:hypothetical protein
MNAAALHTLRRHENVLLCLFFAAGAVQTSIAALSDRQFSNRTLFITGFVGSVIIAYWVMRDSARRGMARPFIFGLLLVILWQILATWHVFRSRGWSGFLTLGIFIGLYLLAFVLPYAIFAAR